MQTRVLKASAGDSPEIAEAVRLLAQGDVVALPTETVYGLAGDALNPTAAARIFEAKQRPTFDPLIVHLPSLEWLPRITSVPQEDAALVEKLTTAFWPGPLTLVLPRTEIVPDLVTSGLSTVAVRMSANPVFAEVTARLNKPLAAPSANRFGRISPTCADHVREELDGRIPLILDGGATTHGIESTIVQIRGGSLNILRPGPITADMLATSGPVQTIQKASSEKPAAPGQLESHYAPTTPLFLAASNLPGTRHGLLARDAKSPRTNFSAVEVLSPSGDLRESAANLFAAMRRLDHAGLDAIVAEPMPEEGLGVAINERLRRAAHRTTQGIS